MRFSMDATVQLHLATGHVVEPGVELPKVLQHAIVCCKLFFSTSYEKDLGLYIKTIYLYR